MKNDNIIVSHIRYYIMLLVFKNKIYTIRTTQDLNVLFPCIIMWMRIILIAMNNYEVCISR